MPAAPVVDQSAVRAWARERGLQVGQRGRLPAALVEQFLAAKPDSKAGGGLRAGSGGSSRSKAGTSTGKPVAKKRQTGGSRADIAAQSKPEASSTRVETGSASSPSPETVQAFRPSEEQLELLEDLPNLLAQLTSDLAALQAALAAVERENGDLNKRVAGLENKRSLFNRR